MPRIPVINLISSSPPSKATFTKKKVGSICSGRGSRRRDFCETRPFSSNNNGIVDLDLIEERCNLDDHKRRRLSHLPTPKETNTRAQTQAISGIVNPRGGPPQHSTPVVALNDDDPFASSPILVSEEPGPESSACNDGPSLSIGRLDPLQRPQTHPPQAAPPSKLHSLGPFSSDPFRSSPPYHEKNPLGRQGWDQISSSEPQSLGPSKVSSTSPQYVGDGGDNCLRDSSDELPDPSDLSRLDTGDCMAQRGEGLPMSRWHIRGSETRGSLGELRNCKLSVPRDVTSYPLGKTSGYTVHSKGAQYAPRELDHEAKSRERQRVAALSEANKIKSTDKQASTREMIIILPENLEPILALQTEALLIEAGVEVQMAQDATSVVQWKRKITSEFNENLRGWEPVSPRLENEHFGLIILTAEQFVAKIADKDHGLAWQTSQLKEYLPGYQIIYLLQGITPWVRKARAFHNRQFVSAVRNSGDRTFLPSADISEESIEDALLELQLNYDAVLIHHTDTPTETAQWVTIFTQHVSTTRYRKHNSAGISFCIDPGQVRSGEDQHDTYVRLLQEVARITAPVACGIAAEYDTVTKLVRELRRVGPLALENLKRRNKDGIDSERTVGQAASRRVYSIFTSLNEASTRV
jgi:crossover junction endonuclease EME1